MKNISDQKEDEVEKMVNEECKKASGIIKRIAGWSFASVFHFYFGESSAVLLGEGPKGEDLKLFITEEWLKENHILRLTDGEEAMAAMEHVAKCSSAGCKEANTRLNTVYLIIKKGLPAGFALMSTLQSKHRSEIGRIQRSDRFDPDMDQMKMFFLWFTGKGEKEFWKWPG